MKPDDRIRLMHIEDALGHAIRFTEGRGWADLDTDPMPTFALLYAIQTVGEAANNISLETRDQHPVIPWPAIIENATPSRAFVRGRRSRHPLDHCHRGSARAVSKSHAYPGVGLTIRARRQPVASLRLIKD